jgi:pectate lyase
MTGHRIYGLGIVCFLGTLNLIAQQVAFPGAEGYGALTSGGRGGEVYEVINLNDSGPGSIREAVSRNHRTVIFRISGNIELKSALKITGSGVTLAGQTAPGEGICVCDYPTIVEADNVIIRYMRFRLGDRYNLSSDAFNINDRKQVIVDHCSITWGGDECASWYGNENVTIQWCMIGEGLSYLGHSMGGLWGGESTYHHNIIFSCGSRHPKFAYTTDGDITDHRNNVIYNWDYESAYTSPTGRVNIVANYYKYGPSTNNGIKNRIVYSEYNTKRLYVADNYVFGFPETTADNWNGGVQGEPIRHDLPFAAPAVSQQDPETAYELVLTYAGASLHRDAADARVIEDIRNGTGQIIARPDEVGGFPQLNSSVPPTDSDHDGLPDDYETANQLNPSDPEDRNDDDDGNAFTNLEEYLNQLIPFEYENLGGDTLVPAAPGNLNAVTFSGDRIDLTWSDHASNERGFKIQYSNDNWTTMNEITQALANMTRYAVTGLQSSTRYAFRIACYNSAGVSGFSLAASDSTLAENHFLLHTSVMGPGQLILDPDLPSYEAGASVRLTGVPDSGFVFDTWQEDLIGIINPMTVSIHTTMSVTASFAQKAENVPLYYDFGPGPLVEGYTQVTNTTAYSVEYGFGFTDISGLDVRDRGGSDGLKRDFVVSNTPRTFIVDLPNDRYTVHILAGDQMSSAPNGPMDVFAEGEKMVSRMFSEGGQYSEHSFEVDVQDGQLNLELIHSNSSSGTWRINAMEITSLTSAIPEWYASQPSQFHLAQNYPNPFNSVTQIRFTLPEKTRIRLSIFNMQGKEVALILDEIRSPGQASLSWNAENLATGVYLCRLQTERKALTRKFILLK